jgi:hypothetical protein
MTVIHARIVVNAEDLDAWELVDELFANAPEAVEAWALSPDPIPDEGPWT